jgi:transposase
MDERYRFDILAQTDRFTLTDLCEQFGISRKTGHKHLARYAASGLQGLEPRSHRPHEFLQHTDQVVGQLFRARPSKRRQTLTFVIDSG